jgi:hypothetical protein
VTGVREAIQIVDQPMIGLLRRVHSVEPEIALGSLIIRKPEGGSLSVHDMTEQPAIQAIIGLGGREKAVAVCIAHHDARGTRKNFDDVGV